MNSSVVIKGSKAGMTVILDPGVPFETLLRDVEKKFSESARFWGAAQMTLTLLGRDLAPQEELQIVNAITSSSQIEILCLLDTDGDRVARCEKALTERLMELSSCTGQFYRGSLERGSVLESEASVVVIGDVARGARVIARGNIVVLGSLCGLAHAGAAGNRQAVIAAVEMAPSQLLIADVAGNGQAKERRLGRGPMVASLEGESIAVRTVKKSFLSYFNFI